MRGSQRGYGVFFLVAVAGAIVGGMLGEILMNISLLSEVMPYLVQKFVIFDIAPITVNLAVVQISLGMVLQPNLISVIGMLSALFLFRRI